MTNPEHLKILTQGARVWNNWREKHGDVSIDFSEEDLNGLDVCSQPMPVGRSGLIKLVGVKLNHVMLCRAKLNSAILADADLSWANLADADLEGANLKSANLIHAKLGAKLVNANLNSAMLAFSDLSGANLDSADLSHASLTGTIFKNTLLTNTNFYKVKVLHTIFGNVDLSESRSVNTVIHLSASTIGIDTIYKSNGRIPDEFLSDAGVPEEIIDIARSLRNGPPIQWHSCFISYSTKDEEFARRLHSRMREANMRVWFAPEDLKGGKKLHEQLFEAIQIHDRLLIVLSEHSIQSEWVMTEIRKADRKSVV